MPVIRADLRRASHATISMPGPGRNAIGKSLQQSSDNVPLLATTADLSIFSGSLVVAYCILMVYSYHLTSQGWQGTPKRVRYSNTNGRFIVCFSFHHVRIILNNPPVHPQTCRLGPASSPACLISSVIVTVPHMLPRSTVWRSTNPRFGHPLIVLTL
jgi:hypothetical protein